MTRLLCVGDQHFGKGAHLAPSRLAEQEACWRDVLKLARDEKVQAVLHAGDAFDRRRPTPDELLAFERPLVEHRAAGGCRIVIISGNGSHDAEHGPVPSPVAVLAEADLVELHREPAWVPIDNVGVCCLPWMSVKHLRARAGSEWTVDELNERCAELLAEIANELRATAAGHSVLLTHFSLSAARAVSGVPVDNFFREPLLNVHDLAAFDAVVAGHVHLPQVIAGEPLAFHVGSPMALAFDEGHFEHGAWLLGVDEEGARAEFRPLASPRFLTFDEDVDEDVTGAYVRWRLTRAHDETLRDPRELERWLIEDGGAVYARVEVETARAQRARVEQLDETVSEQDALAMWLAANEIDRATGLVLAGMDAGYREQVAA